VNIGLSFQDYLAGDAIASRSKGIAIFMGPKNIAGGQCVTGGGGVVLSASSVCEGGIDQGGSNSKVTTLLPTADIDAVAFSTTLSGLAATQTLGAIALTSGQSYTITTSSGLNVIDLPSIVTQGYNTITITAGAKDAAVINVGTTGTPGQFILGPATKILLSGGITPDRVVFNVLGYGPPVTIDRYSTVNGTVLAPGDQINVSTELGPSYGNYKYWAVINGALIAGKNISLGCLVKIYFYPLADIFVVQGSCLPSSSLAVLVQGTNVSAYVPKGSWEFGTSGVSAIQIEGSGTTPTLIPTGSDVINSCAANPLTGQIVCSSNGTNVYILSGTSVVTTLADGAASTLGFSGGVCETCGVTLNTATNQAILMEGTSSGAGGFQLLDLGPQTFETPFPSPSGLISEDVLYDPIRGLILSPSEEGNYELVNLSGSSPAFFENNIGGGSLDSAGEECSTGIALSTDEGSDQLFITDLTQATFTPGSPSGTWSAPGGFETFPEFSGLGAGTAGISVAQGSHLGIVTGEFGGNLIGAIQLPATSGTGTPSVADYVACALPAEPNGDEFAQGFDPHTVTAYVSPNSGDAIGLSADGGPSYVALIDLTKLLNTSIVPRTVGTHSCDPSVNLEALGVVSYVAVP
jgi:choice-of-anchor A domain-containing protein